MGKFVLDDDERRARLRLIRTPGLGPQRVASLIERFGDARQALDWLSSPAGLAKSGIERLARRVDIDCEIDALAELGGVMIILGDEDYPELLATIPSAPFVLSCLGDPALLHASNVGMVGARNASGNGCALTKRLAREVSSAGHTIVSGLARGIDTHAHQGGLQGEGRTIAVIAAGVDIAYPVQNRKLMDEIIDHGLVISERPLAATPTAKHFPQRNRIIAGLSRAVVVVEAAEKSGSLMTARLAVEQGREVMAVPGSPMDARHKGTNRLIKDGAQMVEDASDILNSLPEFLVPPARIQQPKRKEPRPKRSPLPPASISECSSPVEDGSTLHSCVERLLGAEPLAVDELVRQCHASPAEIQDILLQMEMDGRISRLPGNRVALELT